MAEKVEIALTFQRDGASDSDHLTRVWRDVQHAHLVLDKTSNEAPLYASHTAIRISHRIAEAVQEVANQTEAFDVRPRSGRPVDQQLSMIEALSRKLYAELGVEREPDRARFPVTHRVVPSAPARNP
jgi:hypothetical protein